MFGGIYYGETIMGGYVSYVPYAYTPATIATKPLSQWINDDVKPVASWATVPKSTDTWTVSAETPRNYLYDDPLIKYDDSVHAYDFINYQNQISSVLPTQWSLS